MSRYLALFFAASLLPGFLSAEAAERGNTSRVPNTTRLQARVEKLYRAEARADWTGFYEIVSPRLRESQSAESFSQGFDRGRSFEVVFFKILSIRALEKEKVPPGVEAAAAVAMDVSVRFPNGEVAKVPHQTDYWLFVDREWYWSWRGWPYE